MFNLHTIVTLVATKASFQHVVANQFQQQQNDPGIVNQQPASSDNIFSDPLSLFTTPVNSNRFPQGFGQSTQQTTPILQQNPSNKPQEAQPSFDPLHQGPPNHFNHGHGNHGWGLSSNNQQQFGHHSQQESEPSFNPFHQGPPNNFNQGHGYNGWGQTPNNQQQFEHQSQQEAEPSFNPFQQGQVNHFNQGYGNYGWGQASNNLNQQQFGFSQGQQMGEDSFGFSNSPFSSSPLPQLPLQRNPMSRMIVMMMLMNSYNGKSSLKFLMMMLSFGLINPMMFMMLAQQQSENFDEELKDYLVDQWANGKKRLSIDFHKDHLPIEYNFLNQLDGFGGANSGFLNDNNNMFSSIPYQYSNPLFDMG